MLVIVRLLGGGEATKIIEFLDPLRSLLAYFQTHLWNSNDITRFMVLIGHSAPVTLVLMRYFGELNTYID